MSASIARRSNLLDGMILMAGVGGGFLLTRLYVDAYWPMFARGAASDATNEFAVDWCIGEAAKILILWLGLLSPIVLLIRLRKPRPERIELFKQPGTSATATSTAVTAVAIVIWALAAAIEGEWPGLFFYRLTFSTMLAQTGSAIAAVWLSLRLTGRWLAEPSAIDRGGRLIGVGWIVVCLGLAYSQFHQRILVDQLPENGKYYYFYNRELIE